jgi:hypothetical protein
MADYILAVINLALLFLYLPDPNQDLFVQVLDIGIADFPLLPRLPAEIQCRIWQFTLPRGRRILLHLQYQFFGLRLVRPRPTVSKALLVCAQSRQEALRHYFILLQRDAFQNFRPSATLLYNSAPMGISSSRDAIAIRYEDLFDADFRILLQYFANRFPQCFPKLLALEIVDLFWDPAIETVANTSPGAALPFLNSLSFFTRLKKLTISYELDRRFSAEQLQATRRGVVNFFKQQPGSTVPEVVIYKIGESN